jgi:hypothetical protein
MRRPKLARSTVELFSDGEILDSIELYRHGAFRRPNHFPFRRLKTFPDHIEINFRNGEILDAYELKRGGGNSIGRRNARFEGCAPTGIAYSYAVQMARRELI